MSAGASGNGVFQIPHFGWKQRCLKTSVFSSILVPSAVADPDHPLNTTLKTPFRKHRLLLLGCLLLLDPWRTSRIVISFLRGPGEWEVAPEQMVGEDRFLIESKERGRRVIQA